MKISPNINNKFYKYIRIIAKYQYASIMPFEVKIAHFSLTLQMSIDSNRIKMALI